MKEQLKQWCTDLVKKTAVDLDEEYIQDAIEEVYMRFLHRIFTTVAATLDEESLKKLENIFENKDEEDILNEINKYTDIESLSKKVFEEVKEVYLKA